MPRPVITTLTFLLLTSIGVEARATLEFAQVLMQPPYEWSGDCRLCHAQVIGSAGTAVRPFAETLKRYGIGATSSGSELEAVIEELGQEDSDDDGLPDLEELLTGGDPNEGCGTPQQVLVYEYGCTNLAGRRPAVAELGLALAGLLVLRRRLVAARRAPR